MNDPFIILEDNKNIKDKKINTFYRRSYVGEQSRLTSDSQFISLIFNQKKSILILIVVLIFFIAILFRVAYLQVYQGRLFTALAEGNRIKNQTLKANRGLIYDFSGEILAKNVPGFALVLYPNEINFTLVDEQIAELAKKVELEKTVIKDSLLRYKQLSDQPITILDNLSYEAALELMVVINDWSGFHVQETNERFYPRKEKSSHLLGYLGNITDEDLPKVQSGQYLLNDKLGKSGLELFYEEQLRGIDGQKKIEVNAIGEEIKIISEQKPISGLSLVLNLDYKLQTIAYDSLQKNLDKNNFSKGVVVALDPRNGAIRAAVSLPAYDNNLFTNPRFYASEINKIFQDKNNPLFFRVVQGEYPSGSTIKPIYAAAALQEKIVDRQTTILSTGGIRVAQWFFPDWKAGGHGLTNIYKAIAESVNTFFYYLGGGFDKFNGLGIVRLKQYAQYFGFATKTQVDFPVEKPGFFPDPEWKQKVKNEPWYIGDTYNISIGQGDILLTPLQLANAYAALINKGILYQPQFVYGFRNESNGEININQPKILQKVLIDEENLNIIKNALHTTVTAGSARYLSLLPIEVAGKTGTAQVGGTNQPHAWFAGFAPFAEPELVLVILVENGIEGSTTAVPIAFDIFSQYFSTNHQP